MNLRQRTQADRNWLLALFGLWLVSRIIYCGLIGVQFDASTVRYYIQFVDPALLKNDLWRSMFYLQDQPPGFNTFLGVYLKLFGDSAPAAFKITYWIFGLTYVFALWSAMRSMGIRRWLTFTVVSLFMISPGVVLLESWLFYTFPLGMGIGLAIYFLHRFVSEGRFADAAGLAWILTIVLFSRGTFHVLYLALVLGGVALFRPAWRRTLLRAAAVPAVLILALYLKNFFVFGDWFPGQQLMDASVSVMIFRGLPPGMKAFLVDNHLISTLSNVSIYNRNHDEDKKWVPNVPKTGIPILDEPVSSTGSANWHSNELKELFKIYRRDADTALQWAPLAHVRAILMGVPSYFWPADEVYPFFDNYPNVQRLGGLLTLDHRIAGQKARETSAPIYFVLLFSSLLYGIAMLLRGLWRYRIDWARWDSNTLAILYMVFNIAYVGAVTLIFSEGDQNRYRFEVSACYLVLFGMFVEALLQRFMNRAEIVPDEVAEPLIEAPPVERKPVTAGRRR